MFTSIVFAMIMASPASQVQAVPQMAESEIDLNRVIKTASSQKSKIQCGSTEMRLEDCPEWLRGVATS